MAAACAAAAMAIGFAMGLIPVRSNGLGAPRAEVVGVIVVVVAPDAELLWCCIAA